MGGKHEIESSEGKRRQLQGLPVIRRNVAGIDLGSERHWVCAPTADESGREIASFGATTAELIRLADWLKARRVESVAMESTGVYWIAPHEVLEAQGLQVLLVDTRQLARVPGRDQRQTRGIASGFSGGTVADCCRVRFDRRKRSAYCGRWCGIRPTWWRSVATGCGGCKRAWTQMNVCIGGRPRWRDGEWPFCAPSREENGMPVTPLRDQRCCKTEQEIAEQLSGHWREDHLFSLQQALQMYNAVEEL